MEHIAIMDKSFGLIGRILTGEKRVESRWYRTRKPPWNQVKSGEIVYFKDAGGLICVMAKVERVEEYSNLTQTRVRELLDKYSRLLGLGGMVDRFYDRVKNKKYGILVFLADAQRIAGFEIDKTGFGMGDAWLVVRNVRRIKK